MNMSRKEKKHYLKIRNKISNNRPKFRRCESWRYKRVKPNWRKSRGIDSMVRRKEKGVIKSPNIGYRGPKKVRGLHSSGLKEILIHNVKELDNINPKLEAIRIGRTVGILKRIAILDKAYELNIKVLNVGKALIKEEELVDLTTIEGEETS